MSYALISDTFINSCSFSLNTFLSGNCNLYSDTSIGDILLLIAYSTTSSFFVAHKINPTLGFSYSFFTCLSNASK